MRHNHCAATLVAALTPQSERVQPAAVECAGKVFANLDVVLARSFVPYPRVV